MAPPTAAPPAYDGSDVFTPALPASAVFSASVPMGQLGTTLPKDLKAADEATLPLAVPLGPMMVTLPLRGVHVQGRVQLVAGKPTITDGQIHGAVAVADLDRVVYPSLAASVTALINGDPMSTTTRTLISLFETSTSPVSVAKCMVARDCCKTNPSTCKILPQEVKDSVVGSLFAPDVEVLNAMGQWEPVRGGTLHTTHTTRPEPLGQVLHDVIEGATGGPRDIPDRPFDYAALKSAYRHAGGKAAWMVNNGYDKALAEKAVADGADLVAFGKAYIANPDLVRRLREDAPLNTPDKATFYGGGEKGYTDYPALA